MNVNIGVDNEKGFFFPSFHFHQNSIVLFTALVRQYSTVHSLTWLQGGTIRSEHLIWAKHAGTSARRKAVYNNLRLQHFKY